MRFIRLAIMAFLLLPPSLSAAEDGKGLTVAVDHARILRIPRAAESVIIGNPSIVDVAIHDARTLVLTGRSYGSTNLVVLDKGGEVVVDDDVMVSSVEVNSVRVYRQAARTTYSCAPQCEPKVTIGDEGGSFSSAVGQFSQHEAMAKPAE